MRRSSKTAAVIAAVSLAIGACGGSDDDAADTADSVDADVAGADDDGADSADDTGSSQPTDDEGTVGSDVSAPGSETSERPRNPCTSRLQTATARFVTRIFASGSSDACATT